MIETPVLVLSGGNALGAYHAGAWSALEDAGVEPNWILGTSIGAIMASIIAGSVPKQRQSALHHFWDRSASFDGMDSFVPEVARRSIQYAQALSTRILGRRGLFMPRPLDFMGIDPRPSLFDATAMRNLISDIVDFDLLNRGATRVSVTAVDLASGEELTFDTRSGRIEVDHIMASAALLPDFPPVEIKGQLLVDGGLSSNLPINGVLVEALARQDQRLAVFAVDLFPSAAPLPLGLAQAAQRQSDLIFASQTKKVLKSHMDLWKDRLPGADIMLLSYEALIEETPLKSFDFSRRSLMRRWNAGMKDMEAQIALWRSLIVEAPGLSVHQPLGRSSTR
jgi:NTE family protein